MRHGAPPHVLILTFANPGHLVASMFACVGFEGKNVVEDSTISLPDAAPRLSWMTMTPLVRSRDLALSAPWGAFSGRACRTAGAMQVREYKYGRAGVFFGQYVLDHVKPRGHSDKKHGGRGMNSAIPRSSV